jgi:hypothetical protein
MDDMWKIVLGLVSTALLIYLRHSDPAQVKARKNKKLAAIAVAAKKLENERDYILNHAATTGSGHRLNVIVYKLAVLRKQKRELEQAD